MDNTLEKTLLNLTFGEAQTFNNLTLFPILSGEPSGPEYITFGSAHRSGVLRVEEISQGGSVPNVSVTNDGDIAVLLLDGEELAGAKQNRVLNTTVLLKPRSNTTIDVSCTERGRWSYTSRDFHDSGVVMARKVRTQKSKSVSASLETSQTYASNQSQVWEGIDQMQHELGTASDTSAMRDLYSARQETFRDPLAAFPRREGQCGLAFLVDRAVVGVELVSREEAYAQLHEKLVKSYVIDARPRHVAPNATPSSETVKQFVAQAAVCATASFPSVGLGTDIRLRERTLCGSALVVEDTCVHATLFSEVPFGDEPNMGGFRQRRGFRG